MSFLSQRIGDKLAKFEQLKDGGSDLELVCDLTLFSAKYFLRALTNRRVKSGCLNVGLVFNGGIGDQVIQLQWARVFVDSLAQQGCASYNVFMFNNTEMGNMLLNKVEHVDLIADHRFARKHNFDLLISIEYFPRLWNVNLAAIKKHAPFLIDKLKQAGGFYSEFSKLSRVCHHYQLMQCAVAKGWTRYDLLGRCGLCEFDRNTKPYLYLDPEFVSVTLDKFGLQDRKFITFHSGISGIPVQLLDEGMDPVKAKQQANRVIPPALLQQSFVELKRIYPDFLFVHLGDADALPVEQADLNLAGKSSLMESVCLLSKAVCHIDNDAGLIHLRHALHQRSVVLWGPTLGAFVGYPEDENIQGQCSGCMWLVPNWEVHCPKGFSNAKCMVDISVDRVVAGVEKILSSSSQF